MPLDPNIHERLRANFMHMQTVALDYDDAMTLLIEYDTAVAELKELRKQIEDRDAA